MTPFNSGTALLELSSQQGQYSSDYTFSGLTPNTEFSLSYTFITTTNIDVTSPLFIPTFANGQIDSSKSSTIVTRTSYSSYWSYVCVFRSVNLTGTLNTHLLNTTTAAILLYQ